MQEIKEICVNRGADATFSPGAKVAVASGDGRTSFGNIGIYQTILHRVKGRIRALPRSMTRESVKAM
jgi:hypothetical protein